MVLVFWGFAFACLEVVFSNNLSFIFSSLSGNKISDEGASAIVAELKTNTTMKELE
jgi:hypothetical protein